MFHNRIKKLSKSLAGKSVFLAASPQEVFYLTRAPFDGFFVLVGRGGYTRLAAGRMCASQTEDYFGNENVVSAASASAAARIAARNLGVRRVFISPDVPADTRRALDKTFGRVVARVVESGALTRLREIKDAGEVAIIRENQRITRETLEAASRRLKKGVTELALRRFIAERFLRRGAEPAFQTIVAFGKNSAYPHHVSGTRRLGSNDVALIDAGCRRKGYVSDLTRTYLLGKISPGKKAIFETVKAAQKSAISFIRAGAGCADADAAARRVIAKRGFGGDFIHGTGHGLGIDVHETPRLAEKSRAALAENMVVTVEPGVYLPGEFGVRIEDAVVVKKRGCEVL